MRFMLKILVVAASIALVSPVLAATPACTGNVVFGEGSPKVVTSVANKSVNGSCMNDLIVDTVAEGANYTVLTAGTSPLGGAQDIDALIDYMADFKSPNLPYDPTASALNKPRVTVLP